MRRVVAFALFIVVGLLPLQGSAEDIITKGELLTIERCVAIALKRQPAIQAARGALDASQSRVGQARAPYYPQIDFSASYSRIKPATSGVTSTPTGEVKISNNPYDQYTSSASLTQLLFDFGRTSSSVSIQERNFASSEADLENTAQQVVFSVRQAYYRVLEAMRNREVASETVRQAEKHLEQARGFYEVGTRPKFDVTRAEVDVSNARLSLIRSGNAVKVAVTDLNNAMGVPEAPDYLIEDNLSFSPYAIAFEEALQRAYENRPDIQSAVARREAAELTVERARKEYFPILSGGAAYNWSGEKFPLDDGWNIGASFTFPIFSGFLTKYQVGEARANLATAQANEESLKQGVYREVRTAYLVLRDAEEEIPTAELSVRQATENLEIANGRYAAGVGNIIEVTDAEVILTDAKRTYNRALYVHKAAIAGLEKTMGMR